MPKINRWITVLGIAVTCVVCSARPAAAQVFVEPGDAGQTLATASVTTGLNTPLTSITGTIAPTDTDADLFLIQITNTTAFSATASSMLGIDTSLFLFNASGVAVIANDDSSGSSLDAAIPAGNSLLTSLSPGLYYLGISLSGNEPVNLNNQLLFTTDSPSTAIRGPASGLNPVSESTFNGNTSFAETGDYTITLTGAQAATVVPEPSTWALLVFGAVALSLLVRRRLARSA